MDVGGESTRPGAARVAAEEETRRTAPVVEGLRRRGAGPVSIDTTKASVARSALDAGADLVNDVSAFGYDPAMASLVAERGVPAVLMHLRGGFAQMHRAPSYRDVMGEVVSELGLRRGPGGEAPACRASSSSSTPASASRRTPSHSLEALRRLGEMEALDRPVLVGPSRKSFIGKVLDLPAERRLMGTAAAVAACVLQGAHVVRVHDVREMVEVVRIADAIRTGVAGRAA